MPKAEMSKSNVESGEKRIKADKIFTDREEPRDAFWKSYQEIAKDIENYKVLTYYGIGGIGKTTLISKLTQEMDSKNGKYVMLNFEHYESLSKILILRDLGAKLFKIDKKQFKFYRFRFAMKRYAEETNQSVEIKNDNSSFLTNNPLMDLGMDLSENIPDLIEKLPVISTITKAIGMIDKSREIIKDKIDTKNMKKALIEIQTLKVAELVNNIERYFYEDLSEAMLKAKEPLVIFLDTYEKFADSFCNNEYVTSESWLKNIVSAPQGILWVIAGREKLNWEEKYEAEQHLLENLSLKDAKEFLVTAGVRENLIEKIYDLTSGNPVFLDICVDRYIDLINENKIPTIEDFGESQIKLVERYARYMDTDKKELAYLLAYLGKWTTEDILNIKERTSIIKILITDYEDFISHSFIIKDEKSFYMTKVVQKVFYDDIPEILRNEFYKLNYEYLKEKVEQDKEGINIVENLTSLVNIFLNSNPESTDDNMDKIMEILGNIIKLYDKGFLEDEFNLSVKIYDFFKNKPSEYDEFKLCSKHTLSIVYSDIGNYQKALEIAQEVYEKRKEILGEEHPNTLSSLNNLANSYGDIGNYEKALELNQKVYEKRKEILGEEHPNTLNSLNNLAISYGDIGNYEKALELRQKVYEKRKEILGEEHPNTLNSLNNLAILYGDIGNYEKALELARKVYEKRKEILGEEHPNTLSSLNNLANSYRNVGNYEKELELFKEVYEKRKKVLGEEHPDTLNSLNNLAISYKDIGNYEKALELKQKVYEKQKEILGEEHPDTLSSLNNLANSYGNVGNYEKALELNQKVYEKLKEVLGEEHPDTLTSLSNLAISYGEIGNHEKALELNKKVYEKLKEVLGEEHPDTLISLNNLAILYGKTGDYEKALELNKKVYEKLKEVLGEEHPDTLTSLSNLAISYGEIGNHEKELELFKEVYEKRKKVLGEEHPDTLETKETLDELNVDF